jgi:predicted CoA-binding protein
MLNSETVVVLGASPNSQRYSHRAVLELTDRGHHVIPIHAAADEVAGIPVVRELSLVETPVDTVTIYVRPSILRTMLEALVDLAPGRVIFNPGTEDQQLMQRLSTSGIQVVEACTLVLLNTGQF